MKRFTMHVLRARDSCTSYATENTDYLTLVLHSFNTRIVALFLIYICNRLNIYKEGAVKRYIRSLTPKQFLQHIEDIRVAGFSSKVGREANKLVYPQPSAYRGSRIID